MMYKTQFFRENNIEDLQRSVNTWLELQKDSIVAMNSNHTSLVTEHGECYTFYIIYEALKSAVAEVQEMVSNQEVDVNLIKSSDINLQ